MSILRSETCTPLHADTRIFGLSFSCEGFGKVQNQEHPPFPPEQIQTDSFLGHAHREMLTSLTQKALTHSFEGWL